ncbi:hypothetical protein E3Q23_02149 [Wallemia mellicola]|uniref:DH domain-containing protein n=1 Tax=Wallemia mellicola TaxID=1708541 RepID=A0A4T0PMZ1_9BASI|nr:hypothetical protein E3Q23_02149 [Wallemia mellicola]TIC12372.1 hypothetical protein E3Q14_01836 [Wallemia mellicola]TIC31447.1 hypothetical protein E3Q10_01650 [Wallemia mellicola]TIC66344.1 hypothetical protein E3Q01_01771 [Wallemia mellicola]
MADDSEKAIRKARRAVVMSSDLASNLSPSQSSLAQSAQAAFAFDGNPSYYNSITDLASLSESINEYEREKDVQSPEETHEINDFSPPVPASSNSDRQSEISIESTTDEEDDNLFDSSTLRNAYNNYIEQGSTLQPSPSKALSSVDDGTHLTVRETNANLEEVKVPENVTHVMIGNTATPELAPSFLRTLFNNNYESLLVLDIPDCGITTLGDELSQLTKLEELNVSNNLFTGSTLPAIISTLGSNLRLLKADNCGLITLPRELTRMTGLNTLSLRNNRMPNLPAWLCMLPNLELLLVDDNSFSAPWKPIISPILSSTIRDKSSNPPTPRIGNTGNGLLTPQQRSLTTDAGSISSRPNTPDTMRRMKSTTDLSSNTPKPPDRLTSLYGTPNDVSNNTLAPQSAADNQSTLNRKWGIFKKMSINRLRSASNVALRSTYSSHQSNPPSAVMNSSASTINVTSLNRQSSPNPGSIAESSASSKATKRRSFLPLNNANGLGLSTSPTTNTFNENDEDESKQNDWLNSPTDGQDRREEEYARGFRFVMNYLRDLFDLGVDAEEEMEYESDPSYLALPLNRDSAKFSTLSQTLGPPTNTTHSNNPQNAPTHVQLMGRQTTTDSSMISRQPSESSWSQSNRTTMSSIDDKSSLSIKEKEPPLPAIPAVHGKADPKRQYHVIREIIETERTYVKGLQELVDIYVIPSESEISLAERKRVYMGVEGLLAFHKDSMLPSLEQALYSPADEIVVNVAKIFIRHAAFLKIYNIYINEFDYAQNRAKWWMEKDPYNSPLSPKSPGVGSLSSPTLSSLTVSSGPSGMNIALPASKQPYAYPPLSTKERKKIRQFCKAARKNPLHTQMNLESYLLLPIQRIPRYRMLLEECLKYTTHRHQVEPLIQALDHIANIAIDMNESKRDAEGRFRLVKWQSRIRGKFPSPLVQPHRRLLLDGGLRLLKVVKKLEYQTEVAPVTEDEETKHMQVVALHQDTAPSRPLIGLLCTDLMVLCKDLSNGSDPDCPVDLYAVLRIQNAAHPAVVHGSTIRLVDHRAILYLDCEDVSTALTWAQAINQDMSATW